MVHLSQYVVADLQGQCLGVSGSPKNCDQPQMSFNDTSPGIAKSSCFSEVENIESSKFCTLVANSNIITLLCGSKNLPVSNFWAGLLIPKL